MTLRSILLLLGLVCFILAAIEVKAPYVNLQALGLALATIGFLMT